MEKCVRCGDVEEDRRTLWMSCFYQMGELNIPFEETKLNTHPENEDCLGATRIFHTLRVCKECRASWMEAIEDWFNSKPQQEESCGSGIFVRKNGVNVEVTKEQFYKMAESAKGNN